MADVTSIIEERARKAGEACGKDAEFIMGFEREVALQELVFNLAIHDYDAAVRHTQEFLNVGIITNEHFQLITEALEESYKP